ncbi:MAG: nuclear transport factor 2 family protein [Microbacterium sp.]
MEEVVDRFLEAFNRGDFDGIRDVLDDSLVAFVTTEDGDHVVMHGAEAYVDSLREMLTSAPTRYSVVFTQQPVPVDDDRMLVMLEIRASRGGRILHNYSAQLFRFAGQRISEITMTDAKPRESARFWA